VESKKQYQISNSCAALEKFGDNMSLGKIIKNTEISVKRDSTGI
jgi:hypothetical protein